LPWPREGAIGLIAVAIFVVVVVNAFNFLDGADGIAASVAATIAIIYAVHPAAHSSPFGAGVATGLLGACAGFLLFNTPPARIFMGDSGSTVLGFAIAFLSLDFYRGNPHTPAFVAFPAVVAGLPILDALFAVLRRVRNHASPLFGDRAHFYDLLLARGLRPWRVILASVAVTASLGAVAAVALVLREPLGIAIEFLCFAALAIAAVRLGSLRPDEGSSQPKPAAARIPPKRAARALVRKLAHDGAQQAEQ